MNGNNGEPSCSGRCSVCAGGHVGQYLVRDSKGVSLFAPAYGDGECQDGVEVKGRVMYLSQ